MSDLEFQWDAHKRVLGVSRNPFDRLGLSEHIPGYQILAGISSPWHDFLRTAGVDVISCEKNGSATSLLQGERGVERLAQCQREGEDPYLLVTNVTAALERETALLGARLLANPLRLRQRFENKAEVRLIPALRSVFPSFLHTTRDALAQSFASFQQEFFPFVIQNESEQLSGGRGTAVISSATDYEAYLQRFQTKGGERFVVSQYIPGQSYSIQGCVAHNNVVWGPIQQQIVSDPDLTLPGFSQFAGALWSEDLAIDQEAAYQLANKIGEQLVADGYKGIFGIDFIADTVGRPYVTEINARLTALTPLLTMMQNAVGQSPFLLLHALEHSNTPYTFSDIAAYQELAHQPFSLSYALLHNRQAQAVVANKDLQAGVYEFQDQQLEYRRPGYAVEDLRSAQEIIIPYIPAGPVATGKILLRLLSRQPMWSKAGTLLPRYQSLITALERFFTPA